MANGQQQKYDLSTAAQDPSFVNASAQDKIAFLSAHDPDFAKASPKDKAGYLNHILGYDQPSSVERQAQGLTQDQQEAAYSRAYANERERGGLVLSDADVATLGLGGIGAGRSIATQGIKAAAKPIIKGVIGAAGGSAAGAYGGREIGRVFGNPDAGAQIGATVGGFAGGFLGMGREPLPEEGPYVPASKSPGPYRGPASLPKPEPEPTMVPAAQSPGAYRGPSSLPKSAVEPTVIPTAKSPGPYRGPSSVTAPVRTSPFVGATSSNAPLSEVPLPSAGAYDPPSVPVPGLSRTPTPIRTSPFGNATPSNALNANIQIPQAGAYNPPVAEVPGVSSPYAPPTGIKGSIAKPSGRLILSPEEARAESVMQGIAKTRASQHGTLYAAGMRPAGGGRVPMTPTGTETFEYGGQKSAYEPPSPYSRTGGAEGPYSPPSEAQNYFDSLSAHEPDVEFVGNPSGPRGNASGAPGGGGLEEQARAASGTKYYRESPGGQRTEISGLGAQDSKASPGQRIIQVDAKGNEIVLDQKSVDPRAIGRHRGKL